MRSGLKGRSCWERRSAGLTHAGFRGASQRVRPEENKMVAFSIELYLESKSCKRGEHNHFFSKRSYKRGVARGCAEGEAKRRHNGFVSSRRVSS